MNALLHNLPLIFFFYGLAFFSMGLAISLEVGRSKNENEFAWALVPLGWFGLVHGSHEWLEMCYILHCSLTGDPPYPYIPALRLAFLAGSFVLLLQFSFRLIVGQQRAGLALRLMLIPLAIWLPGLALEWPITGANLTVTDVYTRYTLAIPGSILACWGLLLQRRRFIRSGLHSFGWDVLIAALAFLVYGAVGQVFTNASRLFPSTIINSALFEAWFGFPIQLLRAATACLATIFIIRSLRSFEVESGQRLEHLRAEMLHHTVQAQEAERQRIARELHDETGQTLTALGLGLRGLSETLRANPERAADKAQKLESLCAGGLVELQRMVGGLRPPQLDDLGLLPALRWYAKDASERSGIPIQVRSTNHLPELPPEVRTTLFRIAQEAITNAIRHAQPGQIIVRLESQDGLIDLQIEDNGRGFDLAQTQADLRRRPCWGLMGMEERARLIGASYALDSQPGKGARLRVQVRWNAQPVTSPSSEAQP